MSKKVQQGRLDAGQGRQQGPERGREGESYQSCPSPMGMTETVGVRDGYVHQWKAEGEPQTAGLGSLTISFQISQTPYKPSSKKNI